MDLQERCPLNKIIFLLFLISCSQKFELKDGVLFQGNEKFSGKRTLQFGNIKKVTQYQNGIKNGKTIHYYENGKVYRERYYKDGKPDGIHKTFFPNGDKKKYLEFKNGEHHGDYIIWHKNGQVAEYVLYENGKVLGYKKWRKNGQIYANFQNTEYGRLGVEGGKLCYETEDKK